MLEFCALIGRYTPFAECLKLWMQAQRVNLTLIKQTDLSGQRYYRLCEFPKCGCTYKGENALLGLLRLAGLVNFTAVD